MRCVVKSDRRLGSVSADQVDDGFEKFQFFLRLPEPATDNDAIPRPGLECCGDTSLDVVAAIETYQTGFCMEAAVGMSRHADVDRVRDRLRVPWARHPIGVQTDHKDMKVRDRIIY
jgi:hypothetical protein